MIFYLFRRHILLHWDNAQYDQKNWLFFPVPAPHEDCMIYPKSLLLKCYSPTAHVHQHP